MVRRTKNAKRQEYTVDTMPSRVYIAITFHAYARVDAFWNIYFPYNLKGADGQKKRREYQRVVNGELFMKFQKHLEQGVF